MHWLVNRIPQDRAEEMVDELGQHLEEAVQDGKTVEDVVGPDVSAFAKSWAEEGHPDWTAKDRVVEYAFAMSFGVAFAAGALHLLYWTSFLSVHWVAIPMLLFFSWWPNRRVVLAGPLDTRPWWRRWMGPSVLVFLLIIVWFTRDELGSTREAVNATITGNADGTLFVWPWYGTVAAVAVNIAVSKLRK